ncbi:hypothetical protein F2P81_008620 [Scophthalmus maximus]|uniref:Uncharacterized protein n=1 Tax=Scophthalmus maximus TaxID=52904 RepID=A0A6A4SSG6_SCOMX|nr:hypothetical protein F2P81_008620 [Scophthalmus maximus]
MRTAGRSDPKSLHYKNEPKHLGNRAQRTRHNPKSELNGIIFHQHKRRFNRNVLSNLMKTMMSESRSSPRGCQVHSRFNRFNGAVRASPGVSHRITDGYRGMRRCGDSRRPPHVLSARSVACPAAVISRLSARTTEVVAGRQRKDSEEGTLDIRSDERSFTIKRRRLA